MTPAEHDALLKIITAATAAVPATLQAVVNNAIFEYQVGTFAGLILFMIALAIIGWRIKVHLFFNKEYMCSKCGHYRINRLDDLWLGHMLFGGALLIISLSVLVCNVMGWYQTLHFPQAFLLEYFHLH